MTREFLRSIAAMVLAGITAVAPISTAYAQNQAPAAAPQTQGQNPPPQAQPLPAPQPRTPIQISSGPDYTQSQPAKWNFLLPYTPKPVMQPEFVNSPRLDQLIKDGKLYLSLSDAIALALENNLDLNVQRYYSWMAQSDILRTRGGGAQRGVNEANVIIPQAFANVPTLSFDPEIAGTLSLDHRTIAVNNPLIAGTGANVTTTVASLTNITNLTDFQYTQSFHTGTTLSLLFDNTRQSTTSAAVFFNPSVATTGEVAVSQPLLNGAGRFINTRYIRMALLTKKAVDFGFQQSLINDIAAVEDDYWELVFARGNVDVQQQAVKEAQALYDDNKKQVEVGTLAPLEIVRAEAQLAAAQQALITAQLAQTQQQIVLLSTITKNPMAPNLRELEVIPTENVENEPPEENIPLTDAVNEAMAQRPDVADGKLVVEGDDLNVRFTKNGLLPDLTLSGFWSDTGLGGNVVPRGGNTRIIPGGFFDAGSQVFTGKYPEYQGALTLALPIRNRVAQADAIRAQLTQRQDQAKLQQIYSNVAVDVQNALITKQEDVAALTAAQKTRELQEQTLDADNKKLALGTTTIFVVVTDQQAVSAAAQAEVRAAVNLQEAQVNLDRALGRTLEVNRISVASVQTGTPAPRQTLIPGTAETGELIGAKPAYGLPPESAQ